MKSRIVLLAALITSYVLPVYNIGVERAGNIRVMSFNIRYVNRGDTGARHWKNRLPLIVQMISEFKPDVIGLQEAKKSQIVDLEKALPKQYQWFGKQRVSNPFADEEYNPIFYNSDVLKLVSQHTYGLSPDLKIGTRLVRGKTARALKVGKKELKLGEKTDYALARIFTLGTFKIKSSGKEFTYINTHLDHKSDATREEQLGYLVGYVKNHPQLLSQPLFLGGDFNTSHLFPELATIGLQDTKSGAKKSTQISGTFTNWGVENMPIEQAKRIGSLIDYILFNKKGSVGQYAIIQKITTKNNAQVEELLSDHRPVMVDITL